MPTIDLSHTLCPDMPAYPGTEPPRFTPATTLEKDGFVEQHLALFSHTGTHIDAPAHILAAGKTLDHYPIDHFQGPAIVASLTDLGETPIGVHHLAPLAGPLEKADFLLLATGWYRLWGTPQYFSGFPTLTREAAQWLTELKLKGVGMDTISFDPVSSVDLPNHHRLLGAEMILIENLTGLLALPSQVEFSCFPLKIQQADGSPVRAVARWNDG